MQPVPPARGLTREEVAKPLYTNTRSLSSRHRSLPPVPWRDTGQMAADALPRPPAARRHLAIDERGVGLRATWRLEHGFVNLSLWRRDVCVETFHLTPSEASRLVGFLVEGMAGALPPPIHLSVAPTPPEAQTVDAADTWARVRKQVADTLKRTATRLRP